MDIQYKIDCITDEFGAQTWKLWDILKNKKFGEFNSLMEAIAFAKGMGINTKKQLTVDE